MILVRGETSSSLPIEALLFDAPAVKMNTKSLAQISCCILPTKHYVGTFLSITSFAGGIEWF